MTNTTKGVDSPMLLKSDTLGRVRTPAERRERLLDEFERSGLSGQKFAELTELRVSNLHWSGGFLDLAEVLRYGRSDESLDPARCPDFAVFDGVSLHLSRALDLQAR